MLTICGGEFSTLSYSVYLERLTEGQPVGLVVFMTEWSSYLRNSGELKLKPHSERVLRTVDTKHTLRVLRSPRMNLLQSSMWCSV